MQTARRRFLRTLLFGNFPPPPSPASSSIATLVRGSLDRSLPCATLAAPWSALQSRGAKVLGTDSFDDKFRVEVQFQFDIVVNLAQNLCRLRDGGGDARKGDNGEEKTVAQDDEEEEKESEDWECYTKKRLHFHSHLLSLQIFLLMSLLISIDSFVSLHDKGRMYQVLKAQHTQHGRGGATIQVELRDVDTGNKITERFRTDEALERVFVEDKSFTYLYQEGEFVMLMEPSTFEQIEVQKELFGKASAYLKEDMTVKLQYYDGKPMSASVPHRVTCKVVQAQPNIKGLTAAPQYKKVVLDNGLTVHAPPFVETGDEIIINTTDDSYITRTILRISTYGRPSGCTDERIRVE
ncbi:Elongation factor [Musa troglodytarum]|uniref:Elongation factor n=1 Tax=Musa troglodytarum TaxID=320322 RepID=A0A9E7KHU5_9LILI|nr:Elongation factor [Musa troglodytarum]